MKSPAEHSIHPSLQISNLFDAKNGTTSSAVATSPLLISPLNLENTNWKNQANESDLADTSDSLKKTQQYRELSTDEDEQQHVASTSAPEDGEFAKVSRIRKRRYSQARIQPTRVKKVMQSDEDIGRMVASVPVAIGSAMEVFAEKLLVTAAECVQQSSSKTLSPMHIKLAVSRIPQFAFLEPMLRDIQLSHKPISSGQSSTTNGD